MGLDHRVHERRHRRRARPQRDHETQRHHFAAGGPDDVVDRRRDDLVDDVLREETLPGSDELSSRWSAGCPARTAEPGRPGCRACPGAAAAATARTRTRIEPTGRRSSRPNALLQRAFGDRPDMVAETASPGAGRSSPDRRSRRWTPPPGMTGRASNYLRTTRSLRPGFSKPPTRPAWLRARWRGAGRTAGLRLPRATSRVHARQHHSGRSDRPGSVPDSSGLRSRHILRSALVRMSTVSDVFGSGLVPLGFTGVSCLTALSLRAGQPVGHEYPNRGSGAPVRRPRVAAGVRPPVSIGRRH